jgi:phage terminase small subunit
LIAEAKKEWRRITPELQSLGLIARIDRAALALYCQAYARWVWCEERLQAAIESSAAKREAAEAAWLQEGKDPSQFEWNDGDGFMLKTPNGNFTYSPHWVGANKASEQVHKYLSHFGLSPSARGRVTPSSNQLPLPGMGEPPSGGFGAL